MKRNPLLIVVLVLIVLGALFFRYLSPSQSRTMAQLANKLQDKAAELMTDKTQQKVENQQEIMLKAEEERLMAAQREALALPGASSAAPMTVVVDLPQVETATPEAEMTEGQAEGAMKRANELLAQAMKAADEAKAQIRIAQKQLDRDMRARPNLSLLQKAPAKESAAVVVAPVEKKIEVEPAAEEPKSKTVISPNAPHSQIEQVLSESVIRFDWTRSILNDDAQKKIETVVKTLKLNPNLSLRVIGHTDANGTEELNNWLGLIRARRVRQQLIAKGINPKRISVSSRGSKDPIDTNDTAMGRWKNRRVEFSISEK